MPEQQSELALPLLIRLQSRDVAFVAPDSLPIEFGHALRRLVLGKRLTTERAFRVLNRFVSLPIDALPSRPLAPRALQLALTHMATFYDALYIALAEREDLKVLTADDGMANAFASLSRTVRLADLAKA